MPVSHDPPEQQGLPMMPQVTQVPALQVNPSSHSLVPQHGSP